MVIPRSTYRLQFNPEFTFYDAQKIVPYLSRLGISHIYSSPIFKARKGSTHGYDIADPGQISDELGGRTEFEALSELVLQNKMGWIQDIVPNHMAFDSSNRLLMHLLENGPDFLKYQYFDIEWNHQYEAVRGKLLAPLLGDIYSECLERGEITLHYDRDGFSLQYYSNRFPLKIETYINVLSHGLEGLKTELGESHSGLIKLLGVLYAIKNIPASHEVDSRIAQVSFTKAILWELYNSDDVIRKFIDTNIKKFNGIPGKPDTFTLLDELHSEQLFKLSFWKVANEELNYRRFFTVNDLISVRVEDEQVFRNTHELIFELINQGRFDGVRVDHIDGLYDPQTYLERLRKEAPELYIVVEKILAHDETLAPVWPVQGTTGYDFLNYVNELFCDCKNKKEFDEIYSSFSGFKSRFEYLLYEKKKLIISKYMVGDIDNVALLIKKISGQDRRGSDITLYGLRRSLVGLLAFFPVYRSYITGTMFSSEDRGHLQKAILEAKRADPGFEREFAFIERFLLLQYEESSPDYKKQQWTEVVMRFQQFTGPLMAKGFEDTVLYVYNRLISLNEVGSWPNVFGIAPEIFHHFNLKRAKNWPNTMNSTSTHDTKRGEDTRARINVLSEIPQEWESNIKRWSKINKIHKFNSGEEIPDSNDEYFFYQSLIGAYPFNDNEYDTFVKRMCEYMLKSVKEAEAHTAWIKADTEYEVNLMNFINKVLDRSISKDFHEEFSPFQKKVAKYGLYNSLSQCFLKMTSPGIPDFYQGTELWDLSLVDPDNRRPVDFKRRIEFLNQITDINPTKYGNFINELFETWTDGRIKLFMIYRILQARNENFDIFQNGHYVPLHCTGIYHQNIITFIRKGSAGYVLAAVPRLLTSVVSENKLPLGEDVWKDTELRIPDDAPGKWTDAISGKTIKIGSSVSAGELFEQFPAALLVG